MAYIAMTDTEVADLCITFAGTKTGLKLKRGQIIPLEMLDQMDVKKSIAFGAMGRLIGAGFIREVTEEEAKDLATKLSNIRTAADFEKAREGSDVIKGGAAKYATVETMSAEELLKTRQEKGMVGNMDIDTKRGIDVQPVQFEQAVTTDKSGGLVAVSPERRKPLGETADAVVDEKTGEVKKIGQGLENYQPKTPVAGVASFSDFERLNHFDKLLSIRQLSDKTVLSEIADKAVAKQIKNEARKRISELA